MTTKLDAFQAILNSYDDTNKALKVKAVLQVVTTTTLPSSPQVGELVYVSDANGLAVWTGTNWGLVTIGSSL